MADYIVDLQDIKFVLFEQIGLDELLKVEEYEDFDNDMFVQILEEGTKVAKEVFFPLCGEADLEGVKLIDGKVIMPKGTQEAWDLLVDKGWIGMRMNPEYGGTGIPEVVFTAVQDVFVGANPSLTLTPMLSVGAGHLVESFGTDAQKELYIEKMYAGKWAGTMCLTEAGAGTDVGASKTKATRQEDGTFKIEGTKIFITAGDHDLTENIIHAVLARIEGDAPGTKGISLFAVPKFRVNADGSLGEFNDVKCVGIEHKMGIHASPTCQLAFGEDGNCVGTLLGEERGGMKAMFQMMNEARIGVGMQGAAAANAAYQQALAYTKERLQGSHITKMKDPTAPKVAIIEHPDIRRSLMMQKAYSEGMRALLFTTAYYGDMVATTTDDATREKYDGYVQVMTPICKAYCTDMGFRVTEWAMQCFGGYGYCHEYAVEQMMRDTKIASIYEGANGIQAMDLVGRKLAQKMGANFMSVMGTVGDFIEANGDNEELKDAFGKLIGARDAVNEAAMYFMMTGSSDVIIPLLNAYPFLMLFGDLLIGRFLLEQAVISQKRLAEIAEEKGVNMKRSKKVRDLLADDAQAAFYWNKIKTAHFFCNAVLSESPGKAAAIKAGDKSPMDVIF